MSDPLHLFVDTNTLLHYPPIKDVDWKTICKCDSVRLILCLQVIHELDKKKDDSRLGDRASRAIKEIRSIRAAGGVVREGVTLEVFNYEIRLADFPDTLSPDSPDDRIVHSVKKYLEQHPGVRVAVYSEDMGMGLRCEAHALAVVEPDSTQRLENPQDELTKKYRQAVGELNNLKNRQPNLAVLVTPTGWNPDDAHEAAILPSVTFRVVDVSAAVGEEKVQHPKIPLEKDDPFLHDPRWVFLGRDQTAKYNDDLEKYYTECEKYFNKRNKWVKSEGRFYDFELYLANKGKALASNIQLDLIFPPFVRLLDNETKVWLMERNLLHHPRVPEEPDPDVEVFPSPFFHGAGPSVAEQLAAQLHTPKVQTYNETDGAFLSCTLGQLLNGDVPTFLGQFTFWFSNIDQPKTFGAKCHIRAAELPEEVEGRVVFKVNPAK